MQSVRRIHNRAAFVSSLESALEILIAKKQEQTRFSRTRLVGISENSHPNIEHIEPLAEKRRASQANQAMAYLINSELQQRGKNKDWLAEQLGKSSSTISRYSTGLMLPSKETRTKILNLFNLPYKTLDEYMQNTAVPYEEAYLNTRITNKPSSALNEYAKCLSQKRKQNPRNMLFSQMVRAELKKQGKNLKWLAEQTGHSSSTASRYASGDIMPRGHSAAKFLSALNLPYKTIDEALKEYSRTPQKLFK